MAYTPEPEIAQGRKPEDILQAAVTKEIIQILEQQKNKGYLDEYFILPEFGLDIAIFIKRDDHFSVRFFELKAFVGARPGGVGFGNQRGEGSQVDLLLLEKHQLNIADKFIRWILMDGAKATNSRRFVFFTNEQAKSSAMNGVIRGKQNNLRVNRLITSAITWDELSAKIESFLKEVD
ncbi:MAG: hypothetical protein K6T66_14440 [Peptococcaceae bacterium]|nr:hypothetical protein [Peptococcaceae bacterium]